MALYTVSYTPNEYTPSDCYFVEITRGRENEDPKFLPWKGLKSSASVKKDYWDTEEGRLDTLKMSAFRVTESFILESVLDETLKRINDETLNAEDKLLFVEDLINKAKTEINTLKDDILGKLEPKYMEDDQ